MAVKRGLQGAVALRKKLKRIDELAERRIGHAIEEVAQAIMADALARAPRDTGGLERAIEYSISSDKLSATIGPGAKAARYIKKQGFSVFANRSVARKLGPFTKEKLFQVFKGHWVEFGTKGHIAKINKKRGKRVMSDTKNFYGQEVNIPTIPPRPFMEPAWDVNASWAKENVKNAVNGALKTVAKSKESDT